MYTISHFVWLAGRSQRQVAKHHACQQATSTALCRNNCFWRSANLRQREIQAPSQRSASNNTTDRRITSSTYGWSAKVSAYALVVCFCRSVHLTSILKCLVECWPLFRIQNFDLIWTIFEENPSWEKIVCVCFRWSYTTSCTCSLDCGPDQLIQPKVALDLGTAPAGAKF